MSEKVSALYEERRRLLDAYKHASIRYAAFQSVSGYVTPEGLDKWARKEGMEFGAQQSTSERVEALDLHLSSKVLRLERESLEAEDRWVCASLEEKLGGSVQGAWEGVAPKEMFYGASRELLMVEDLMARAHGLQRAFSLYDKAFQGYMRVSEDTITRHEMLLAHLQMAKIVEGFLERRREGWEPEETLLPEGGKP